MTAGAALHQGGVLVWDPTLEGIIRRLEPFLARGFHLTAEKPVQNAGAVWMATLTTPADVDDARNLGHLVTRS